MATQEMLPAMQSVQDATDWKKLVAISEIASIVKLLSEGILKQWYVTAEIKGISYIGFDDTLSKAINQCWSELVRQGKITL